MAVRKPFKLKGRTNYYTVVDGRRFCLDTADPVEAERKYNNLLTKHGTPRESGVRLASFRRDFLEWSLAAQARPTWKANRLALDKLAGVADGCMLDDLSTRHIDMVVAQERP